MKKRPGQTTAATVTDLGEFRQNAATVQYYLDLPYTPETETQHLKGIEKFPDETQLIIRMADYYMRTERPMSAHRFLRCAFLLRPENPDIIQKFAEICTELAQAGTNHQRNSLLESAERLYFMIIDIDGTNPKRFEPLIALYEAAGKPGLSAACRAACTSPANQSALDLLREKKRLFTAQGTIARFTNEERRAFMPQ